MMSCDIHMTFPVQGKGKENVTHYPRARYTYLDIPNIHAVRESYENLRTLCLSSESSKWYSSLENTQWLSNLSLIIKVQYTMYVRTYCIHIQKV